MPFKKSSKAPFIISYFDRFNIKTNCANSGMLVLVDKVEPRPSLKAFVIVNVGHCYRLSLSLLGIVIVGHCHIVNVIVGHCWSLF